MALYLLTRTWEIPSLVLRISVSILLLAAEATSVSFSFQSFNPNTQNLTFQGDSFASDGVLQLTKNTQSSGLQYSAGRVSYDKPVRLWDAKTGQLSNFITRFSFKIQALNSTFFGDGMTFDLSPFDSNIPANSSGGYLALFSEATAHNASANQIVAVEFDTFQNYWDPSSDHVGINVNSIESVTNVSWNSSMKDGSNASAWISYNAPTFDLSVFLTYANDPTYSGESSLSYTIDLREYLPEMVRVGFSAATGSNVEIHNVLSWSFNSSLEEEPIWGSGPSSGGDPSPGGGSSFGVDEGGTNTELIVGLVSGLVLLALIGGTVGLLCWRKKRSRCGEEDSTNEYDHSMDDEFEKGTGPKRFTYRDLSRATNGFAEEGKLGEGGFGGVYKGLWAENDKEIAVKRISRGSKQGRKEYISEVKIISRLRHRNLVQLIGWCHEQAELLLVYEFMPNGSLDGHLFGGKSVLAWPVRYKIAQGLASALLYLHEEWEQCVVHRDIKSSNVMLDSDFNAKLGDFGLARFVDHGQGAQTTVLAGTMGYMAPEFVITGKASKESDVYSFGVVSLEIACGRRPVELNVDDPSKVRLVEWVWSLYGRGELLNAVDKVLPDMEYDENEIECLMVVGLWCCHPDYNLRPSIRQVLNVLNFEAPLPSLPSKLPVPMYYAPPLDMKISYRSSNLYSSQTQSFSGTETTDTSNASSLSTKALLKADQLI